MVVARRVEDGRYLFVRWPDWPYPAMLALDPPHPEEGFTAGVALLLSSRFSVQVQGEPLLAEERRPVRMRHPYAGGDTIGWLHPVAVEVAGDPVPDPLAGEVLTLTREEAIDQLPTDLERIMFTTAAALLPPATEDGSSGT